jgi:ATP-independent RNA helicase DbpA
MSESFSQLPLNKALLDNLLSLNYVSMTDVQAQALPDALNEKDVIVQAKTGSGKTAVFGLSLLNKLNVNELKVQSLVLCPTRELADQVAAEIRRLARGIPNVKIITLCGGVPAKAQVNSLEHGAHVVIGTPGRIQDHLDRGSLILDDLNILVLDEADRMLDMGFQQALDDIIEFVPNKRQTLLFSATFPSKIASIADRLMVRPIMIHVKGNNDADIEQKYYRVKSNEDRLLGIQLLMLEYRPERVLIFCNTKSDVNTVSHAIMDYGFNVLALHGDLDQKDRDQTLIRFTNKSTTVLVATDVAARGLDIDDLDMVINYHVASDTEVHLHRIGRTGRAGKQGSAHAFFAEKESYKMQRLAEFLGVEILASQLPSHAVLNQKTYKPPMMTLRISGGKKQKLRAGDILGALTSENGITGQQVGKITLFDYCAYVAVNRDVAQIALNKLRNDKLKGKTFKIWLLKD